MSSIDKNFKCQICSYQNNRLIEVINHIKSAHPIKNDDATCSGKSESFSKHVKGHQDDTQEFQDLDRLAQLNVIVDEQAKIKLTNSINSDNNESYQ